MVEKFTGEYEKGRFVEDEFTQFSILASFQLARIYRSDVEVTDKQRQELRDCLWRRLQEFKLSYESPVLEEDHLSNISKLADELTRDFSEILADSRFRIGIAQKALNLYLKYMWCLDRIGEPPHCPLDATVNNQLSLDDEDWNELMWTKLDSIDSYRRLVSKAREKLKETNYASLPQWELNIYFSAS